MADPDFKKFKMDVQSIIISAGVGSSCLEIYNEYHQIREEMGGKNYLRMQKIDSVDKLELLMRKMDDDFYFSRGKF